ncbi:response regulator [Pontibacter sp. MBLB2868]|uniref:response regulator n=1 Tax=Pontibacter sp. MBLB2868 TaxID=3451555 RepID=UPI003F75622E
MEIGAKMDNYNQSLDLVMLVDDDTTTNYLNERLLKEVNVAKEIIVLKNGKEAFDYLKAAAVGTEGFKSPNLIFLDIKMPVMDGFSFLEEYQSEGLDATDQVIILMLTSSASFYDLERLRSFKKVKKHFSKALTKHDVRDIMAEYFASKK